MIGVKPRRMPVRVLLLAALAWLLPAAARAQERSLEIRSFAADLIVRRNGALDVKETLVVAFQGEWNGIYRTIPVEYRTGQGLNYHLRLHVRGVHDDAGSPLRYELKRQGADLQVKAWVPGARDAVRTVVFEYSVDNALRFFREHDELYWNVTGDRWEYPILSAAAAVYLPPNTAGLRSTAFTGTYGSVRSDVRTDQVGNMVRFHTRESLGLHEGLTIVVGWDPGMVERPTRLDRILSFLASNALLLLPLLALLLMYRLWRRFGRDPELGAIAPIYEPPAGMTPAEAGTLTDLSVDMRDITATLVHLAVRGYLRIEETERTVLLLLHQRDYRMVRLRDDTQGLKEHERDLLEALFEEGSPVTLSSLENRFYKRLPKITDSLKASLVSEGYYPHSPTTVRTLYLVGAMAAGWLVYLLGMWLASRRGTAPATAIAAGILTALVVAAFGWFMPARTARGTRMLRAVLGFQEFLQRVEADRLARIVDRPELFEQYLPYAMALGVEKRWAAAFEDICRTPPSWYQGPAGSTFRPGIFIGDLGHFSRSAGSTMRSAPRSSSGSSGFGGGGFSGGGFGGGGGGGF